MSISLVGGPMHRLAARLGLARGSNASAFGVALGVAMWLGVIGLAAADGSLANLFSLSKISGHLRLLVVIPLLFYAEALVDPAVGAFVGTLERSGVVRPGTRPALDALVSRIVRWSNSWAPDSICLAVAIVLSLNAQHMPLVGATAATDPSLLAGAAARTYAFWIVCLTIFRFLILRWAQRLVLWTCILWRLSRLDLHLLPTHPDGAAGLGYLEVVQSQFTPLVLALSIVQSSALVEELAMGRMTITEVGPAIGALVLVDLVLFVAPLLMFTAPLRTCRVNGLRDYMEMGSDYVSGFDRKWIREDRSTGGEELLGTADLQSLADLNNSLATVRNLRLIPASSRLLLGLGVAAAVPMLPLLLFKYPVAKLVAGFFTQLTGL